METAVSAEYGTRMYIAEIVINDPPGPASEQGLSRYRLPLSYGSMSDAVDAAENHIARLRRPLGSTAYRLLNDAGDLVGGAGEVLA